MKHTFLALFVAGATACNSQPADHFVLRGTVPGAMDSTEVVLTPKNETWNPIAKGYIIGERFELQGSLPYPTCCRLSISNGASPNVKASRAVTSSNTWKFPSLRRTASSRFKRPTSTVCPVRSGHTTSARKRITA